MTVFHTFSAGHFAELARGEGDAECIRVLREGQLSKNIITIRSIMDIAAGEHPEAYAASALEQGYDLLAKAQARSAAAVAIVLSHPQIGAWAAHCMRRLGENTKGMVPDGDVPMYALLGHLNAIAAAAAIRADHEFDTTVPVRPGGVFLPTLGLARFGDDDTWGSATVRLHGGEVTIAGKGDGPGRHILALPADLSTETASWQPLRSVRATAGERHIEIDLDDLDPYRSNDCPPRSRVGTDAADGLRRTLDDAWNLLVRLAPDAAESISAGVTSIVPLVESQRGLFASSTSRDSFGAIAMTMPGNGLVLADTLIHEFHHSKLNAILDLVPLIADSPGELFYSPWRDDPRPMSGVLHGAYAFLGVADFARRHRSSPDNAQPGAAHFAFAHLRLQLEFAMRVLTTQHDWSPDGAAFVERMRARIGEWRDEAVPSAPLECATDLSHDHHLAWRLRNLVPDPDPVRELAAAWLNGAPCPIEVAEVPHTVPERPRLDLPDHRALLFQLKMADPQRFAGLNAGSDPMFEGAGEGRLDADIALVRGDHTLAIKLYLTGIAADHDTADHWAGLCLAYAKGHGTGSALVSCPEIVRAVFRDIKHISGKVIDPVELADWMNRHPRHGSDMTGGR